MLTLQKALPGVINGAQTAMQPIWHSWLSLPLTTPSVYRNFAKKQIHYMLGDSGRSFVVGFGHNPPQRPHHSSSSCPSAPMKCDWRNFDDPKPNAHVLKGALVGGPDENDNYEDDRTNYEMNEVTTDYNAGFQSAVAGLKQLANS